MALDSMIRHRAASTSAEVFTKTRRRKWRRKTRSENVQTPSKAEDREVNEVVGGMSGSSEEEIGQPGSGCLPSEHAGRHLISVDVPIPVDQLFTELFTDSRLMTTFNQRKRYYDIQSSEWKDEINGTRTRQLQFNIDVNNALVKTSRVTEDHTLSNASRPGQYYIVNIEVNNSGLPMVDLFWIQKHVCLYRVSSTVTHLDIWSLIMFRKSTIFKSFIEKGTNDGLDDHHKLLKQIILETFGQVPAAEHRAEGRRQRLPEVPSPADHVGNASATAPDCRRSRDSSTGQTELLALMFLLMVGLLLMNVHIFRMMTQLDVQTESLVLREQMALQMERTFSQPDGCVAVLRRQESDFNSNRQQWASSFRSLSAHLRKANEILEYLQGELAEKPQSRFWSTLAQHADSDPIVKNLQHHIQPIQERPSPLVVD